MCKDLNVLKLFFMKEIGIESKGSKGSRVMVERSNEIMTIGLALHMVQGVRNIAMTVGERMMRDNLRGRGYMA